MVKYLLLKVVVDFLDPLLATEVLLLEVVDILSGFRDRRRCSDVTVSSANEQFSDFYAQNFQNLCTCVIIFLSAFEPHISKIMQGE